jgi:hypothetical protein
MDAARYGPIRPARAKADTILVLLTNPAATGILYGMIASAWLNTDLRLGPGTELFRAERCFQLWAYSVSHSRMLLRSTMGKDRRGAEHGTRIDVLFKPVAASRTRSVYDGLVIRVATVDEAAATRAASPTIPFYTDTRVFLLHSGEETDYVVADAVGWHEDTLDSGEPSHFAMHDPDAPEWQRTRPLGWLDGGLNGNVASVQQLIDALMESDNAPAPASRPRYRHVYVVMFQIDLTRDMKRPPTDAELKIAAQAYPAGVFLTVSEAEQAQARLASKPEVNRCWIEGVPVGI